MNYDRVYDTFPKLLQRNARRHPDRAAMREKKFGIWQTLSWSEVLHKVQRFAVALHQNGVGPGDKVAIIGDNRPQWVIAEIAAQACGAAAVGIYPDSVASEVAYVIDHCDAKIVVAEDQEQIDKLLEMLERLPKVRLIVYSDPRGLRSYADPILRSFESMEIQGAQALRRNEALWPRLVDSGAGGDVAVICYTSGTTGRPKGAMLTYHNMLSMVANLHKVDPRHATDEFVSFLPLPWIGEQMIAIAYALSEGFTVNFPEEPSTIMDDLREIAPHTMFAPPRIWENMNSMVQVKIMDTTPFKRWMYETFMPIGHKVADLNLAGKPVPPALRVLYWLADWVLFKPLKDRLGLTRMRTCATGGAALGPDVFRFFHALGVPLKQLYGQTEIVGISCIHRDGEIQVHTVGPALPNTEIRISESGEILARNESVFAGYYKDEESTRQAIVDGWLHSGDAGYFTDDGHMVVIDRVKDVMRLADGTKFSPQFIENRLKFSPYIKEAVAIGKDRPYLTAIICIDMGTAGKWAERSKIAYTTYSDLASKPEVYALVEQEVRKVNETLPPAARIKKFVLLYKELDADDDELTRTRKVRRSFVEERYSDVIAGLYGDATEVPIDAVIKFQDGKTSRVQAELHIRQLIAA